MSVLKDHVPREGSAYKRKKYEATTTPIFLSHSSVVTAPPDLSQKGDVIPVMVNLARKPQQCKLVWEEKLKVEFGQRMAQ